MTMMISKTLGHCTLKSSENGLTKKSPPFLLHRVLCRTTAVKRIPRSGMEEQKNKRTCCFAVEVFDDVQVR